VGRIDKHLVWHLNTLAGGPCAKRRAECARKGGGTVCLIRG
jgi:hypothetical protein